MTRSAPRPRPHVMDAAQYLPGRSVPGLVKLSSNESVLSPSVAVQTAIAAAASGLNRYPPHLPELVQEAVVRYLADHAAAPALAPEQVLVGNGSVTLLRQLFEAYVEDGDRVVMAWRSFEAYPLFAHLRRADVVPVPLREGLFDVDALVAAAADPATRLVLLTTPNNPSGAELAHDDVARIADAAPEGCLVVVDNAYGEFQRNRDGVRPFALVPERPQVLVLRTLAKAFSLAGLRVGYGVGHPDVVAAVDRVRSPFEVNALAQVAAVAALGEAADVVARAELLVAERRRCLAALWDGGLPVGESQGNFVWLATGPHTALFTERFAADGYVVRAFPDDGIRVTVVDPADNDAWVASALRTWSLPQMASRREQVAETVSAARPAVATGVETAESQRLSYAVASLLQD